MTLWAEYINTAFVIILIYFSFWDFTIIEFINKIVGKDIFDVRFKYSDFDRQWYIIVANKLLLPFFLLIFNPHTSEILRAVIGSWIRHFKNKGANNLRVFMKNN